MKAYSSISIACVDDGKGISEKIVYYLASDKSSGVTNDPAEGWTTTPQTTDVINKYLWTYEETKYTNGDSKTTTPIIISTYNKVIKEVVAQYYCSTDGSELIGGKWLDEPDNWGPGITVFVKYITIYDDDTQSETTPAADETYTTIGDWCILNDKTLINGANIATGTITADHIQSRILQSTNGNLTIDLNNGTISMLTDTINVSLEASDTTFFSLDDGGYYPAQITLIADAVYKTGGSYVGHYVWYKDGVEIRGHNQKTLVVLPSDIKDGATSVYRVVCPVNDVEYSDSIDIGRNIGISVSLGPESIVLDLNEDGKINELMEEDTDGNLVGSGFGYLNTVYPNVKRQIINNGEIVESNMEHCSSIDAIGENIYKYYIEIFDNKTSLTVNKMSMLGILMLVISCPAGSPPKIGNIVYRIHYYNGTKLTYITKNVSVCLDSSQAIVGRFSLILDSASNTVTPASLVLGINQRGESDVKLKADSIEFEGMVTANKDFKIDLDGSMIATGGTIGGWTINDSSLYRPYEGKYEETGSGWNKTEMHYGGVGFKVSSGSPTDPILWAGYTGSTAEDGDGTPWGAAKVDSSRKWTDYTKFWVDNTGHVYAKGGEIGGCKIVDGVLQVGNANITTGLDASKITTGTLSASRIDTKNLYINGENVTTMVKNAQNANYSTSSGTAGSTGYVTSGGTGIASGVYVGGSAQLKSWTYGIGLVYGNGYLTVVSNGAYMGDGSGTIAYAKGGTGYLMGTWYNDAGSPVSSDINKKHDINSINDDYEKLFDGLNACTYKYNNGTSDRLHTGFIAQDVEQAIIDSGMTTQDFAGFVRLTSENIDTNEEETFCYLRYSEFVSLNTWQIQKCKKRISDLEAKIAELEEKIDRNEE